MRYHDNGDCYTITYTRADTEAFAARWPCSDVHGRGSFTFDAETGDLVDATGSALGDCEPSGGWSAFAADCQRIGDEIRSRA